MKDPVHNGLIQAPFCLDDLTPPGKMVRQHIQVSWEMAGNFLYSPKMSVARFIISFSSMVD